MELPSPTNGIEILAKLYAPMNNPCGSVKTPFGIVTLDTLDILNGLLAIILQSWWSVNSSSSFVSSMKYRYGFASSPKYFPSL